MVVLICSQFEQKVESIVEEKISAVDDPILQNFIRDGVAKSFRNPEIKKIKGLLSKFDGGNIGRDKKHKRFWLKTKFDTKLKRLGTAKDAYDSIIAERHKVAHGDGTSMTLHDVITYYRNGRKILTAFKQLLLG